MNVENGFDLYTRERVLSMDNAEGTNPEFWQEFCGTAVWKRFAHVYGATQANFDRIADILNTMYPDQEFFTIDQVTDVFIAAIDSGGQVSNPLDKIPVQIEVPVQEPESAPTDRNGKKLSASQIAWGEMVRWSETSTSAQRAERRRTDPAYARFYHTNLLRSLDGVGDSLVDTNPHLLPQDAPTKAALKDDRLVEFARRYNSMSSAAVRSACSRAVNPLTADRFIKDMDDAIRLNLI
jgi:hypothetical protein